MRGVHPFQRLSLGKRLTLLVMIAMALSCIVLAAAMTVAGDQMLYTIYASQTTVTRGDDRYGLPTVSKGAAASGTVSFLPGRKGLYTRRIGAWGRNSNTGLRASSMSSVPSQWPARPPI